MTFSITLVLVVITVISSIAALSNERLKENMIFYPPAISNRNQWYRFFTYGFIHADYQHLIFNMLSLYLFGRSVEAAFIDLFGSAGRYLYLALYLSALVVSLLPTYFRNKDNHYYRGLGASGAVSAVIFAGLMLSPETEVYLYFIPLPIPGFIFAPLYLILSAILDRRGRDNINHSAHLWGAIYGLVFVIFACRFVGYNVIAMAIERIKWYMNIKGWTH